MDFDYPLILPIELGKLIWEFVDFPLDLLSKALQNGTEEQLNWFKKHLIKKKLQKRDLVLALFSLTIEVKNLRSSQWLAKNYQITCDEAKFDKMKCFRMAAQLGDLDTLKWFDKKFKITAVDVRSEENYALRTSAWCGHFEQLRWLIRRYQLNKNDITTLSNDALRGASRNCYRKIVYFLLLGYYCGYDSPNKNECQIFSCSCGSRKTNLGVRRNS